VSSRRAEKLSTRDHIVASAIACIASDGADNIVMDDIARTAGLSRQGIYKALGGRDQIMQTVLLSRIAISMQNVRKAINAEEDIGRAFVEGSLLSVELAESDPILISILKSSEPQWLQTLLFDKESPIRTNISEGFLWAWRDLFLRARTQSMLRDDLSDLEVAEWLRHMQWLIQIRSDLATEGRRLFLEKFLLASILSPRHVLRVTTAW
jgi:AcrR family transcriptional regulator